MTGLGIGGHQSAAPVNEEWLTPPFVLDALGGADSFDLDPCAPVDRLWPVAKAHWTVADNGLIKPWHGRVWMNPPYSTGVIGKFMRRMAEHGRGTALIFARTETEVFQETVFRAADAVLFLEGRLHFHVNADTWFQRKNKPPVFVKRGDPTPTNAGAPSVLVAYGANDADILAACGLPGAFCALRLRSMIFGFASVGSWVDEVMKVMERAGDAIHLDQLYRALAGSAKARRNEHWREKIRQTLQRGPFEPLGNGVWQIEEPRLI